MCKHLNCLPLSALNTWDLGQQCSPCLYKHSEREPFTFIVESLYLYCVVKIMQVPFLYMLKMPNEVHIASVPYQNSLLPIMIH